MSNSSDEIYIPLRFEKAIALHLLKNRLFDKHSTLHPTLLLGIDGLPGTGKTFLCQKVVEKLGYKEILISGGELESKNAGEPAELIRERYLQANRILATKKYKGVVIIFNDIETGIGDWGDGTQYTVNRQTVFGELMHIADYPNRVAGEETERIPIIITGNDFSKLYEPLTRAGRFESFTWAPSVEETLEIVYKILKFLDKNSVKKLVLSLVQEYKKLGCQIVPISFFTHFKTLLINDALWHLFQEHPNILEDNIKIDFDKFFSSTYFEYDELLKKAKSLLTSNYFETQLRNLNGKNKQVDVILDKNLSSSCNQANR